MDQLTYLLNWWLMDTFMLFSDLFEINKIIVWNNF